MKFLADMGISPKIIGSLTKLGYNAVHLQEEGLHRLPDSKILTKALQENRILLTHDLDFGDLIAANQMNLPSVIIFRLHNMSYYNVNVHLTEIINKHGLLLQEGVVISVTEGKTRIRQLPI